MDWWKNVINPINHTNSTLNLQLVARIFVLWWTIWKAKNTYIFRGSSTTLEQILREANYMLAECDIMAPTAIIFPSPKNETHSRPSSDNSILIFTNVTFKRRNGRAGYGFAMSFDDSFVCAGGCKSFCRHLSQRG